MGNHGPSAETTFLSEKGCLVTNARFTYAGQTYAMANVTSVKAAEDSILAPLFLVAVGAFCLIAKLWVIALFPIGIGVLLIWLRKRYVILHTAGAEQRALSSRDAQLIQRVIGAVNDAIVHRG